MRSCMFLASPACSVVMRTLLECRIRRELWRGTSTCMCSSLNSALRCSDLDVCYCEPRHCSPSATPMEDIVT
eukprot:3664179-Prymnesium_polylepis.2